MQFNKGGNMENEICKFCGDVDCDGVKYWAPDPYALEINDDNSAYFECDGERWASAQDI